MRLENFASIDPDITARRSGLRNLTPLGKRVFEQWRFKRDALKECADLLIRENRSKAIPTLFESNPAQVPRAFAKYELLDLIGEGGSGVVFSCLDPSTAELFAIKIVRTDRVHEPDAIHRFRREIKVLKSIEHDNVIRIYEDNLGSQDAFPAYVMDLCIDSYTSLMAKVASKSVAPLTLSERRTMVTSMLDAVEALHTRRPAVIHRDINPNNVLRLDNGAWVLADFGLAKFVSTAPISTSFLTTTQRGWGTMWYTAPEQYRNFQAVGIETDIYSLGILIWEAFTESHPPPDRDHLGLPEILRKVVIKAIDRDPDRRHLRVSELRDDFLNAFESDFGAQPQ